MNTNTKNFKISFCTVSMNRLHHLKRTLPKNLEDNAQYDNIEFVVLDYSSTDGMLEWIQEEMMDVVEAGILKYYRVEGKEFFHRAHSRNMVMKRATGDIIVNLDADNFTGEDFAQYINDRFNEDENIFLRINYKDPEINKHFKDSLGRVAVKKSDFEQVGGYDEAMEGYGHEDQDLYYRLEQLGLTKTYFSKTDFLHSISHSREERIENEKKGMAFSRMLISYLNQNRSVAYFLFDNGAFESFIVVPSFYNFYAPVSIIEGSDKTGTWKETEVGFELDFGDRTKELSSIGNNKYTGDVGSGTIMEIMQGEYLKEFKLQYTVMKNARKHHLNRINHIIDPNDGEFGLGDFYGLEEYEPQLINA